MHRINKESLNVSQYEQGFGLATASRRSGLVNGQAIRRAAAIEIPARSVSKWISPFFACAACWYCGKFSSVTRLSDPIGPNGTRGSVCMIIRRTLTVCSWVLICLVFAAQLQAQGIGDKVVITAETTLKIRAQEVGKVYPGTIFKITHEQGKWFALEGRKGWINATFVMNLEAALQQYGKRITLSPRDLEAVAISGLIYYHKGDYEKAIDMYNKALGLDRKRPQLWNNRSLALIAQGRFELAEKDLQQALTLQPKYGEAYANLGWVNYSLNNLEVAIDQYNKAIEFEPENSNYFVNRGSCHRDRGETEKALADFATAIEMTVNLPSAFVGQSSVYLDQMKLDEAILSANRALELDRYHVQALINRGWAHYLNEDNESAISDLSRAIALDDQLSVAFINRAAVYLQTKDVKNAEADLKQAMQLDPQSPALWLNQGELLMQKKDHSNALVAFEKCVEFGSDLAECQNGLAWILATCPNGKVRDPKLAVKHAQIACKLSQNEDWSHLDTLAAAFASDGKFDDAIKVAQAALKIAIDGKKGEIEDRLALYRKKQPYLD